MKVSTWREATEFLKILSLVGLPCLLCQSARGASLSLMQQPGSQVSVGSVVSPTVRVVYRTSSPEYNVEIKTTREAFDKTFPFPSPASHCPGLHIG